MCNDDYSCEVIYCEVLNLEYNEQHIIDIKLDVLEKELAKQKVCFKHISLVVPNLVLLFFNWFVVSWKA
jgi:hypothetical protein